jgi:hypothetical protein
MYRHRVDQSQFILGSFTLNFPNLIGFKEMKGDHTVLRGFDPVTGREAARYWQAIYALYHHLLFILMSISTSPLLIIILVGIVDNIEESKLVDTLGSGDNTKPISQLLLLEELLCPISTMSA